jgi:hypothetical protein
MSVITPDLPAFIYPPQGPILPPYPESTIQPNPPENNILDEQWYLESALQDPSNYPRSGFGSFDTSMRVGDIIQPQWEKSGLTTSVVNLCCLLCLPAPDGTARIGDGEGGFPFCQNDTATAVYAPRNYWGPTHAGSWNPENLEMYIPVVDTASTIFWADEQMENTTLACTIVLEFEPFFAFQAQRSEDAWLNDPPRMVYNRTYPFGRLRLPEITDTFPPTSSTFLPSNRFPWLPEETEIQESTPPPPPYEKPKGWESWPVSRRVSLIVGVTVGGFFIAFSLFCCTCTWPKARRNKSTPLPSSVPPARRQSPRPIPRPGMQERIPPARVHVRTNREAEDAPPPAYHEAVSEQDRMRMIQGGGAEGGVLPPRYV